MVEKLRKESTVIVNDKEFKVISVFAGDKTASELLHKLAIKRIMNESENTYTSTANT